MGFPQFMIDEMRNAEGSQYCGYCKCDPCRCDGLGGSRTPVCGYCHDVLDVEHDKHCDGFGHPLNEDGTLADFACKYCGTIIHEIVCSGCGQAQ